MKKKIEIKSLMGEAIAVEVGDSDTVAHLKQKIFNSHGIDSDSQRFVLDGAQLLDNHVTVVDQIDAILAKKPHLASIEDDRTVNDTVTVVLQLTGGATRSVVVISSGDSSEDDLVEEGDGKPSNCPI